MSGLRFIFLGVFALTSTLQATQPLDGLAGRYPIVEANGQAVSGWLDIVSNEQEVGIRVESLSLTSDSLSDQEWLSPVADTALSKNGDIVSQEHRGSHFDLSLRYEQQDGLIAVRVVTYASGSTGIASEDEFVLSNGKSIGTLVDPKTFFQSLAGDYLIRKVALDVPEEGKEDGFVEVTDVYALVSFQYCVPEKFCDPIFVYGEYPWLTVYENELDVDTVAYDIIINEPGMAPKFYRWTKSNNALDVFQNYQYMLDGVMTGIEHEVEPTP